MNSMKRIMKSEKEIKEIVKLLSCGNGIKKAKETPLKGTAEKRV